ncbi:MAG: hypothetical protein A2X94_06325 [Bdellovibrionales bacterium GWB1_55_8]|nr:MAG: hypothetical protein A2X94_06325 [Bdellovibrionales bacterium GWB1_55_8]
MKASTVLHTASALLIFAAIAAGPGCSKKNATGESSGSSSGSAPSAASVGADAGSVNAPAAGITPSKTSNARSADLKGAASGAPAAGGVSPTAGAAIPVVNAPVPAPEPPKPECFRASFSHPKLAAHSSDELCSQHQNLLTLKHKDVNSKSLCVRVNGRPVRFDRVKGHPERIIIGPIAGPKAVITANYCIGKAHCPEECKIPKDEFLDAIGGTEEVGQQLGKWLDSDKDTGDVVAAQLDSQLKKELADLEDKGELFSGWNGDSEARECGRKIAISGAKR